jgi:Uma2 family endonuclease
MQLERHPRHASLVDRLNALLVVALGNRAVVRVHNPLSLATPSAPDIAVVPPGYYDDVHPKKAFLVVEVPSAMNREPPEASAALYASSWIAEYWRVNASNSEIEVHRHPNEGEYQEIVLYERGDVLTLVSFPDVSLPLGRVFP